ncbi:MAG: Omp28 family outer membrane lipoprotein [Bacteroides sp.]|nr:Omp28 family outer membrane lipoprotein [Bacteroides sp.]
MKLDKITLATFALAGITSFCACDNIAEDDRYIPVEKPVIPIEEVSKVLLIQEFTGDMCPNCPSGAEALHSIQDEYGDNVVIVGMHPFSGGFTAPIATQDFRTEEAEAMYNLYKPAGFPCAIFNGTEASTAYAQWFTTASGMVGQIANMSIKADCNYEESSRELTVDYTINMTHDISNNDGYGVMVWLMENDITGFQLDNGTMRGDYVHNHVLRASLNGVNGQVIGNSFKSGESYRYNASITLDENWNAENCQIVVYMFNAETHEVEQTVLANVISEKVVEDPHKVPQTLLIQEFTGDMCPNCPSGASALHSIQESSDRVVAVGMHPFSGGFTAPIATQDFRTDIAEAMYNFYKPAGFPCAIFNGTESSTAYGQWFTMANNALLAETNMTINASTSFDADSREVTVNYYVDFTEDVNEDINIMVWVMENNIIGFQLNNGSMVADYEHNHVLRASLTGDWGENIGKEFANGQTVKGSASMTLDENWVAENCQIVVFTIDNESKAVRQTTVANINVTPAE